MQVEIEGRVEKWIGERLHIHMLKSDARMQSEEVMGMKGGMACFSILCKGWVDMQRCKVMGLPLHRPPSPC